MSLFEFAEEVGFDIEIHERSLPLPEHCPYEYFTFVGGVSIESGNLLLTPTSDGHTKDEAYEALARKLSGKFLWKDGLSYEVPELTYESNRSN